ncbi:glycosyltransferase family 2 protein [uncultured Flavobacterium sp.]|uniref:glycosyltransferase family 2 protein n=1 Tax=uncultured Flavobacterium sp. TaxID=165435 RepID=UPI00292F42F9|nr:glycosyltransferase family 2 protein [uncultured Flavobacterium sp.]
MIVSASIVLYNTDLDELSKAIGSIFQTSCDLQLFLIDNSPIQNLNISRLAEDSRIKYIHNPSNPGFGAAHNIAIEQAVNAGHIYHFIVNPDIYFSGDIISPMIEYMKNYSDVGMMMPQILNLDGSVQNLPKLLPSPYSVLMRKFKRPKSFYIDFINRYELRFVCRDLIYNAPVLSGCFTLLNLIAIKDVGMYDDKFFMYFEDWDLSRRMHEKYKTIYFPKVSVFHGYDSGANSNRRLFKIFINSAIVYFNKWGWIWDPNRNTINKKTLAQFTE